MNFMPKSVVWSLGSELISDKDEKFIGRKISSLLKYSYESKGFLRKDLLEVKICEGVYSNVLDYLEENAIIKSNSFEFDK